MRVVFSFLRLFRFFGVTDSFLIDSVDSELDFRSSTCGRCYGKIRLKGVMVIVFIILDWIFCFDVYNYHVSLQACLKEGISWNRPCSIYQYSNSEAFRTSFYIWWRFLCIQVSSGN